MAIFLASRFLDQYRTQASVIHKTKPNQKKSKDSKILKSKISKRKNYKCQADPFNMQKNVLDRLDQSMDFQEMDFQEYIFKAEAEVSAFIAWLIILTMILLV